MQIRLLALLQLLMHGGRNSSLLRKSERDTRRRVSAAMVNVPLCTSICLVPLLVNVCQCRPLAGPGPVVVNVERSWAVPRSSTFLATALHPPALGTHTFTTAGVPRSRRVRTQSLRGREHQIMDRDYMGWLDFGKRHILESYDAPLA